MGKGPGNWAKGKQGFQKTTKGVDAPKGTLRQNRKPHTPTATASASNSLSSVYARFAAVSDRPRTRRDVQLALEQHDAAERANPTGSKPNLKGADLQEVDLSDVDLSRVDLSGANLRGAILPKDLRNTDFTGADLSGADLRGVYAWDADFTGAKLEGANMENANMEDADLKGAQLHYANLKGAKMVRVNLDGANMWMTETGDSLDLSSCSMNGTGVRGDDRWAYGPAGDSEAYILIPNDANLRTI